MNKVEEYLRQEESNKKTDIIMGTSFGFMVVVLILILVRSM